MPSPLVSAVVLNYRSPQFTVTCAQALAVQTIANQLEILVVENHSEDDSIGVLRNRLGHIPSVRILENRANTGYGKGNQFGIDRAQGKNLLIVNPDNTPLPDCIEKLVAAMEKDPAIGIVAPQLIHEDGTIRDSYRSFPRFLDVVAKRAKILRGVLTKRVDHYLQAGTDPHASREVDWVVGACFLIRKDLFQQLGGFDPRFFLFFEDIDLCKRVRQAGKTIVYLPEAKAYDRKRRLSDGGLLSLFQSRVGREHVKSGIKYFWKWGLR